MIDHIGTNRVSVRAQRVGEINTGLTITQLSTGKELELTTEEWFDLALVVEAVKAASDFKEEYEPA